MEKKTAHAAEQDRPDVLKRRQDWFDAQPDLDPDRLVFIDETWASTNMARRYGRAPRGQRLRSAVPHGHWKTTTFIAGLRLTGLVAGRADQRPELPDLCRACPRAGPATGRCGRDGQSRLPQGSGRAGSNRDRWCNPPVSAALQP